VCQLYSLQRLVVAVTIRHAYGTGITPAHPPKHRSQPAFTAAERLDMAPRMLAFMLGAQPCLDRGFAPYFLCCLGNQAQLCLLILHSQQVAFHGGRKTTLRT